VASAATAPGSLLLSVDTEEDNWGESPGPLTCENARELPGLVRFFERLGVRPTMFTSHEMLVNPTSRDIIRDISSEPWVEIGGHVHPWNTPPFDVELEKNRTMMIHYPEAAQQAKIAVVTERITEVTGERPTTFRSGRFSFSEETARALLREGYRVDSSYTPLIDWSASSEGPDFTRAPREIFRLGGRHSLDGSAESGLVEVPLTIGFTKMHPSTWGVLGSVLQNRVARRLRVGGVLSRVSGLSRVVLSPEPHRLPDLLAVAARVLEAGLGHVHLFFHSSSLVPGLTPFTRSRGDVLRLYDTVERFVETVGATGLVVPRTVHEAAFPEDAPVTESATGGRERVHLSTLTRHQDEPMVAFGGRKEWLMWLGRMAKWRAGAYGRYDRVRWEEVRRLVFVCRGNICRSAYGHVWAEEAEIPTASLGVLTKTGGMADERAIDVAAHRGIVLDSHRTTALADFQVENGDLFVAMEPWHARLVEEAELPTSHQVTLLGFFVKGHGPSILDPYGRPEVTYDQCFGVIEAGIREMKDRLDVAAGAGDE